MGSFETQTIYHLRDLVSGERTRIACDDVKVYQCPHYKGLAIEHMLLFARPYPAVARCLPKEPREVEKLHRDHISTVIYTIVGQPFDIWVLSKIRERNAYVEQQQDMSVHLDPEIAAILQASSSISVSKGISNNLLKVRQIISFFKMYIDCLFYIFYRHQQREEEVRHRLMPIS